MKRKLITAPLISVLITCAVAVSYLQNPPKNRQWIHPDCNDSSPQAFSDLPPTASGDQFAERIHGIGLHASQKEQTALVAWMNRTKPNHLSSSTWHYLVNDIMDVLCQQREPLPSWSDILIDIAKNPKNDQALRDYAIQHLVDRLEPINIGIPCEMDPAKRRAIVNTMLYIAHETRDNLAGTAVLGLHLVLETRKRDDQEAEVSLRPSVFISVEQLRAIATTAAIDRESSSGTRSVALQICAERGFSEVLPTARRLAEDIQQPLILRLSAVAAIGQLGTAVDVPFLKALEAGSSIDLVKAIQPALRRIHERDALSLIGANPAGATVRQTKVQDSLVRIIRDSPKQKEPAPIAQSAI